MVSFALPHQSKMNKTGDAKTSTPAKHVNSTHHECVNNLDRDDDSPDYVFHLQRTIGNQAVQRILLRSNADGFDFAKIAIQPKLKISQPGDEYELEADRTAEQVMRMSSILGSIPQLRSTKEEGIDRRCAACQMREKEEEEQKQLKISRKPSSSSTVSNFKAGDELFNQINIVRSGSGSPLDATTKEFMESRFGYDFSSVKIHTDEKAASSSNSVNALAYTIGNDIVFGEGHYEPNTLEGRRLLAHELTHVVQQNNG
jgi:hypothetical protein